MKLSDITKKVIHLADAARDYWEAELPKRHPNYPFVNPGEDSGPPPPEEKKLRDLFKKLPDDVIYKLALIKHLGRDKFEPKDLEDRYQNVEKYLDEPELEVIYMVQHPSLGDELARGLEKLKKSQLDVDKMFVETVTTRK